MTPRKQIEERLREQLPQLAEVGGASTVRSALDGVVRTPAAFVIDSGEKTSGQPSGGMQSGEDMFAVILVVSSLRDRTGADSADVMWELREQRVKAALNGFHMDGYTSDLYYQGGRALELGDGLLSWQLNFSAQKIMLGRCAN
jgi:hypothetical protein